MPYNRNLKPKCNTANLLHNSRTNFCDKVVVNTVRVFDACMQQFSEENATLTVEFATGTPPYTFISGQNTATTISNQVITPIEHSPCSRVQLSLTIPMVINAIDSTGLEVVGTATVVASKDVILRLPSDALTPAVVDAVSTVVVLDGVFTNETTLICTLCYTIVVKIIANVDLVLPTAGYPLIPECEDYSEDVCASVFNQSLYPHSR